MGASACIFMLGLWLALRESEPTAAPVTRSSVRPAGEKHESPSISTEGVPARRSVPVGDESATSGTIYVSDAWGRAMSGVGVWSEDIGVQWYSPSDPAILGFTDESGRYRPPPELDGRALQIGKRGMLTQRVIYDSHRPIELKLVEGGRITFDCRSIVDEGPIGGVLVGVSIVLQPLPMERPDWSQVVEGAVPAAPLEEIVFFGVSNSDTGMVVLDGVPPAAVAMMAWSHDQVLASVSDPSAPADSTVMRCPGAYSVRLAPLSVCGFQVKGDAVVDQFGRPLGPHPRVATPGEIQSQLIGRRLADKYPGAHLIVMPYAGPGKELRMELHLSLRERGEHDFTLPFVSLEEFARVGPTLIDAATLERRDGGSAFVKILVRNGDGALLPDVDFLLMRNDGKSWKRLVSGLASLVPSGTYTVSPELGSIRRSIAAPEKIVVVPQATREAELVHVIDLQRILRPVHVLKPKRPREMVVKHENGGQSVIQFPLTADRARLYLPLGRMTFIDVIAQTELASCELTEAQKNPVTIDPDGHD